MYKDVGRKLQPGTRKRKANAEDVNDHCRLSKSALKLKCWAAEKMSYISTENLINSTGEKGETLAELCFLNSEIEVSPSTELSDRVCKSCVQKNASRLISMIKRGINAVPESNKDTLVKRQLSTSVLSPEVALQEELFLLEKMWKILLIANT